MSGFPIFFPFFAGFIMLTSTAALAQHPVIDSSQLKTLPAGEKNVALIDSRSCEKHLQAHIPAAISIPADQVQAHVTKHPKDKTTPIIFYCRGLGCTSCQMSAVQAVEWAISIS
jgi:Rhodanese-like domain